MFFVAKTIVFADHERVEKAEVPGTADFSDFLCRKADVLRRKEDVLCRTEDGVHLKEDVFRRKENVLCLKEDSLRRTEDVLCRKEDGLRLKEDVPRPKEDVLRRNSGLDDQSNRLRHGNQDSGSGGRSRLRFDQTFS